jgi:uracil phosphoribosyltransferase
VPPHPLVKHWLAVCRNAMTPPGMFRGAMAELGRILIYEAVREFLPTMEGVVDTPMGQADVEFVDPTRPIKARFSKCMTGTDQPGPKHGLCCL